MQKSISILASSSLTAGAQNKTLDGSSFRVSLNDALHVPNNAENITVEVTKATYWNTSPNFKSTNNQIYVRGPDVADVLQSKLITLPVGLYDVSMFKAALLTELLNEGFKQTPSPVLNISANYATGKIIIILNYTTTEVSFAVADGVVNPMNQILGFDLLKYTTAIAPFAQYAPNVAKFNQLNSILITSNLCDNGFAINSKESNIIAQILINVSPGTQLIYEPFNPTKVSASNLQNRYLKEFDVQLTDELLVPIDTNTEEYTVLFKISYTEN
jgi:hypothetical protein